MPRKSRRRRSRKRNVRGKASKFARFISRFLGSRRSRGHGLGEMRNIYNKLFEINDVIAQLSTRVMSGISEQEQVQISAMLDRFMADAMVEHGPEMVEELPAEYEEVVEEIEPENVEPEVMDEIEAPLDELDEDEGDYVDEGDEGDEEDEDFVEGEGLRRRRRRGTRKGTRRGKRRSTRKGTLGTRKSVESERARLRRKHPGKSAAQINNMARFSVSRRRGARGGGKTKEKADKSLKEIKDLVKKAEEFDFKGATAPERKRKITRKIQLALDRIIRKKQIKAILERKNKPRSSVEKLLGMLSREVGERGRDVPAGYARILRALEKGKDSSYLDNLLGRNRDEDAGISEALAALRPLNH